MKTLEMGVETADKTLDVDSTGESFLNEQRLLDLEPYEIIINLAARTEFRFLERGVDADGEFLRAEFRYQANAISFPEHIHPKQAETFKVLSGELVVTVAGDERSLGPGEQVTLPAGIPHIHRNADIKTRVLWELRPPLAGQDSIRWLAALVEEGRTNAEGTPNLLPLAVFADANPDLVYLSSPPIAIQKLLFKLLAILGRRRGYGYTAGYPAVQPDESL